MSRAISLALTKAEAIELRGITTVVLNSPQVWREADGWHLELVEAVNDRLADAIEEVTTP